MIFRNVPFWLMALMLILMLLRPFAKRLPGWQDFLGKTRNRDKAYNKEAARLDKLLRKGAITRSEYEAMQATLLRRTLE